MHSLNHSVHLGKRAIMKRRQFLKSTLAAGVGSIAAPDAVRGGPAGGLLPRRAYRDDIQLSIIGFGGIVIMGLSMREAASLVAEVHDRGVNYFDVAPAYGSGEAEEKLGPALKPVRGDVFLACKTGMRDGKGAREELERSLKRMRTDHFDLYQLHAVTSRAEVDKILGAGGALETFARAREEGKIRYIGFSAHDEEAAIALMDGFSFDSILFPVNFVCIAEGNFGPRVLQHAKRKAIARLALKAMAYTPWPEAVDHTAPKCWYRPIENDDLARMALRYTLSQDVTSAVPPGDERFFRIALNTATSFTPITESEQQRLSLEAKGLRPIFRS